MGTRSGIRSRSAVLGLVLSLLATGCQESRAPRATRTSPSPTETVVGRSTAGGRPSAPIYISDAARKVAAKAKFDLRAAAQRVHKRVLRFWPDTLPNINVDVKWGRRSAIAAGGEATFSSGQVFVDLYPRFPGDFERELPHAFRVVVAHELNHSARIFDGPGYGGTLLHGMISEGLAEAFVLELYPESELFSETALTPAQESAIWPLARKHLDDANVAKVQDRWFFGKGDLPNSTGYALGLAIIQSYLRRHPKEQVHDITLMPAKKIFRRSGYDP